VSTIKEERKGKLTPLLRETSAERKGNLSDTNTRKNRKGKRSVNKGGRTWKLGRKLRR